MNVLLRFNLLSLAVATLFGSFCVSAVDIIRDPTTPLVGSGALSRSIEPEDEKKKHSASLKLQGVLVENGRKIAVINNRLVRVGEEIEGYKVTSIIDYGADLIFEEETLSLSLLPENIKISHE